MDVSMHASQIIVVGQKIRQIRKSRRLTQSDLATRIGITQSDLSRMENGEYKVGLDTLFRILQVFELSMSRFFEEPDVEPAEPFDDSEGSPGAQTLIADFHELDEGARQEVRDFISFKKQQQRKRAAQALQEPESLDSQPAPTPEGVVPFGRPGPPARADR
jgi:transcriptional regulator with XRE-family HTH domain